jgi:hypothetical protein
LFTKVKLVSVKSIDLEFSWGLADRPWQSSEIHTGSRLKFNRKYPAHFQASPAHFQAFPGIQLGFNGHFMNFRRIPKFLDGSAGDGRRRR